jgi:hypothetical protein
VEPKDLEPYLHYWLDSIAGEKESENDVIWQCALLTFINYYDYQNVKYLLGQYGYDIEPNGKVFKQNVVKVIFVTEP